MAVPSTLTNNRIADLARLVLQGNSITPDDALALLATDGPQRYDLFYWANRIRLERFGPNLSLCSIASARTGSCSEDCRFCAQSAHHHTLVQNQQLSDDQLLAAAQVAAESGADCFGIVSSGLGPTDADIERLAPVIRRLTTSGRIMISASLGLLTTNQAYRLYDLGLRRYHHNLETSARFFPHLVSTHTYDQKLATIRAASQAGLQVCSGGIVGLGESLQDRVELAFALRELDVVRVPVNFLQPISGTPLERLTPITPMAALQTIAMFRFVLPDKHLNVAGGRDFCLRDLQSWIFFAGASGAMVGNYLTTTGRPLYRDLQMLADLELPFASY
jgi:biotin synthase